MTVTLHNRFLGFGVHFGNTDDDWLLYLPRYLYQKKKGCRIETTSKGENVGEILRSERIGYSAS